MRDLAEGTKEASEAYGQLAISIGGATASGALIGSVFGPAGTAVGAILGGLGAIVTGFAGYNSALDETQQKLQDQREEWRKIGEECDEINNSWNQLVTDAQVRINSNELEMQSVEKLTEKLESLFDINGKIKSGYEDRAEFILNELNGALGTEYELTGNQITQNGELYDSYSEIKDEIYNLIEAKRAQAMYEANSTLYKDALSNSQAYYDAMMKAKGANDEAYESMVGFYNYYMNNWLDPNDWATPAISNVRGHLSKFNVTVEDIINNTDKWKNALNSIGSDIFGPMANQLEKEAEAHRQSIRETGQTYEETKNTVNNSIDAIVAHEQLGTALITADQEEIAKALEEVQSQNGEYTSSFTNRVGKVIYESNRERERLKEDGKEITEEQEAQLKTRLKAVAENLKTETATVGELTPDIKNAWKMLAEENVEVYNEALSGLDGDIRKEIQETTGVIISETEKALPKVEKASSDINDVITKNMDGTFSINFGLNADYSGLKTKLQNMRNTISKMTSVPLIGASFLGIKTSLDSLINQLSVAGYAEGGFPDMGEIFMARESGPELVGRIGSRTAVANNSQIVEAVSRGVFEAVSSAMPKASTVQLDIRADEGIIVKKASQGFKDYVTQTGELPFPIPV